MKKILSLITIVLLLLGAVSFYYLNSQKSILPVPVEELLISETPEGETIYTSGYQPNATELPIAEGSKQLFQLLQSEIIREDGFIITPIKKERVIMITLSDPKEANKQKARNWLNIHGYDKIPMANIEYK